ncbi:hypothetical protein SAMN05421827_101456 [Pedobacter terrae]|uniref:Uncharacterized protein n=1 Tax=Pedobacter terrae TaxID=405671 RepID=A0A1G7NT26_9SPHI|nr:hypothetical protein SAMN05421827_101456 [Pedobacter terrae]
MKLNGDEIAFLIHPRCKRGRYGQILNLTATNADQTRQSMMSITAESPTRMLNEIQKLVLPNHHEVKAKDVDLKRLGSILWLAQEKQPKDF